MRSVQSNYSLPRKKKDSKQRAINRAYGDFHPWSDCARSPVFCPPDRAEDEGSTNRTLIPPGETGQPTRREHRISIGSGHPHIMRFRRLVGIAPCTLQPRPEPGDPPGNRSTCGGNHRTFSGENKAPESLFGEEGTGIRLGRRQNTFPSHMHLYNLLILQILVIIYLARHISSRED
jgi:hypothetical protein